MLRKEGIYTSNFQGHVMPPKEREDGRFREIPFSALAEIDEDKNPFLNDNEVSGS